MDIPRICPSCNAEFRLVRNGTYRRQMVDELGTAHSLLIQRVRCRECRGSHSLLYDFLVPYRKYCVRATAAVVERYLVEQNSYLGALTATVNEPATLFGAVRNLLCHLPVVWMYLARQAIAAGSTPKDFAGFDGCPNSRKSRNPKKRERLDWASRVLKLFPELFEKASAQGYPLFASGRGCELLRTHSAECALF